MNIEKVAEELDKININKDSIKKMEFPSRNRSTDYGMKIKMDHYTLGSVRIAGNMNKSK